MTSKTPSGVEGLDLLIGGFQEGSLILLAGSPGSGKTMFAGTFLHQGAKLYEEPGVYVSFAETRKTLIGNFEGLGLRFGDLEGKVKFLDYVTPEEKSLNEVLSSIYDEVAKFKAKRLVVDSFSALIAAMREKVDARVLLHGFLSRILRQLNCTTLIISEIPRGSLQIGLGVEEFVADAVVLLSRDEFEGRTVRRIELVKVRGRELQQRRLTFTLHGGFRVFPPFEFTSPLEPRKIEAIPDSETHFSTGCVDLDRLLGGGFPRGSYVLYDVDFKAPEWGWRLPIFLLTCNTVLNGRGLLARPTSGFDSEEIRSIMEPHVGSELFNRLVRILEREDPEKDQKKPYIVIEKGTSIAENHDIRLQGEATLNRATGKPVTYMVGLDVLEYRYGKELDKVEEILSNSIVRTRRRGILTVAVSKTGLALTQLVANMVSVHLKVIELEGCAALLGVKPRTPIHIIQPKTEGDRLKVTLTPLT